MPKLSPQEVAAIVSNLKHVPKLKKPAITTVANNGNITPTHCHRLDLVQTANFDGLLGFPAIHADLTTTTNLKSVYDTFDMEARIAVMQSSAEKIMGGSGEVYVQPKMIQLLADTLNHDGAPVSADRHGLAKTVSTTWWTNSSFEQCGACLAQAANRGEYDDLSQLSAATILGRIPNGLVGTAVCNVSIRTTADNVNHHEAAPADEDAALHSSANAPTTEVPFDDIAIEYIDSLTI